MYPAAPVVYTHKAQLKGLESGEFILQPKWDGRRAIAIPGKPLVYKSSKPVDASPWKNLSIPKSEHVLDLELFRDKAIVIDIIEDIPLKDRLAKIERAGLEFMKFEVSSVKEINEFLKSCLTSGLCDGVVLKRKSAGYPIGKKEQINFQSWIKVKQIIL